MQPIEDYSKLKDFTDDLDAHPSEHLSFKIFGPKSPPAPGRTQEFHSFSMIGYVYKSIDDPDASSVGIYNAPFGTINRRGCFLNPEQDTYSSIVASPKDGNNQFQGDIFKLDKPIFKNPETNYVCLVSHSCEIPRDKLVTVLPVFLEKDLDAKAISSLLEKQVDAKNLKNYKVNWLRNKNKRFIGLPPINLNNVEQEGMVVYLRNLKTIDKNNLPAEPVVRLTYRALSYLQLRMSHFMFRDVQDSDESRSL